MQCGFITKGVFTRILSLQQQDTKVFYRNSLFLYSAPLENPDMDPQFLFYPWNKGTGTLVWHMFFQWEEEFKTIIIV